MTIQESAPQRGRLRTAVHQHPRLADGILLVAALVTAVLWAVSQNSTGPLIVPVTLAIAILHLRFDGNTSAWLLAGVWPVLFGTQYWEDFTPLLVFLFAYLMSLTLATWFVRHSPRAEGDEPSTEHLADDRPAWRKVSDLVLAVTPAIVVVVILIVFDEQVDRFAKFAASVPAWITLVVAAALGAAIPAVMLLQALRRRRASDVEQHRNSPALPT